MSDTIILSDDVVAALEAMPRGPHVVRLVRLRRPLAPEALRAWAQAFQLAAQGPCLFLDHETVAALELVPRPAAGEVVVCRTSRDPADHPRLWKFLREAFDTDRVVVLPMDTTVAVEEATP